MTSKRSRQASWKSAIFLFSTKPTTRKWNERRRNFRQPFRWQYVRTVGRRSTVRTVATQGEGIQSLIGHIETFERYRQTARESVERRKASAERELMELLKDALLEKATRQNGVCDRIHAASQAIKERRLDPYTAVDEIMKDLSDLGARTSRPQCSGRMRRCCGRDVRAPRSRKADEARPRWNRCSLNRRALSARISNGWDSRFMKSW